MSYRCDVQIARFKVSVMLVTLISLCSALPYGCMSEPSASRDQAPDQYISDAGGEAHVDSQRDLSTAYAEMSLAEEVGVADASIIDDHGFDQTPDEHVEAEDGSPPDLVDQGPALDRVYARLSIGSAQLTGSYSPLSSGLLLLDEGAKVRWELNDIDLPRGDAQLALSIQSRVWRFEDGLVVVRSDQQERSATVWGDGRAQVAPLRIRYADWRDEGGYGAGALPPRLLLSTAQPLEYIELESAQGGLIVGDLVLHEVNASLSEEEVMPTQSVHTVEYRSCLMDEMGVPCDDGENLTGVIDNAPAGALKVTLVSPRYRAETAVRISRADVEVIGHIEGSSSSGDESTNASPIWLWSPREGSGQAWPFVISGAGPERRRGQITHPVTLGQRRITVTGLSGEHPAWVRLGADDFGEVPPVCVDGRDVERVHRHQRQLFRVLEVSEDQEGTRTLTLDRAINVQIPLSAQPTLTPMQMVTRVKLSDLTLEADCPEAFEATRFTQVTCRNPEVIDDGGVLSRYTDDVTLSKISARGFGKFTLELRESLLNQTLDCEMRDPSAYGSGGQGYGVHLIGASRSLILRPRVQHARHGVVVDFGSSDSQIIDGVFSEMNQALLDVHGEASRDTLIRGNALSNSSLGVIVGGGGRTVHCNDGPRHHVIDNQISDCGIGVLVSDYTEEVEVRSNDLTENGSHVGGAFGARGIRVERNRFTSAQIRAISLSYEDTGAVEVRRNLFTDLCAEDEATLLVRDAEPPSFSENLWCPGE